MKLSKWRLAVLAFTTAYSILACMVEIAQVVAFRNHWNIHYWHLPDFWAPFHVILFPLNLVSEMNWFWGSYAAIYWPLASIAATVLFWALLTWPIEAMVKWVKPGQAEEAKALATGKELFGLLLATTFFVLLCYFMIKAFPGK